VLLDLPPKVKNPTQGDITRLESWTNLLHRYLEWLQQQGFTLGDLKASGYTKLICPTEFRVSKHEQTTRPNYGGMKPKIADWLRSKFEEQANPMVEEAEEEVGEGDSRRKRKPSNNKTSNKGPKGKHESPENKKLFVELHLHLRHEDISTTITYVHEKLPNTFKGNLHKNTAGKWVNKYLYNKKKEKEEALAKKEKLAKSGRTKEKPGPKSSEVPAGTLAGAWRGMKCEFALLVMVAQIIMAQVTAGVPLTVPIIKGLVLGIFAVNMCSWVPCNSWYRSFVKGRMRLSWRKGTKPARHLPPDFDSIKKLYVQRFVWTIMTYSIVACMYFNLDETGCVLFPMPDHTWAPKGAKDAVLHGLDEKRQFTATPVISAAGFLVAHVQLIWAGLTNRCEAPPDVQTKHDDELRHTHTKSHWSTPSTVMALITDIYDSTVEPYFRLYGRPDGKNYWVVVLDVYWSHRDPILLKELRKKYPYLIILFVPASCTPELQPLDVDFNGAWKQFIKQLAALWVSSFVQKELEAGKCPTEIVLPYTKTDLVAPFCEWIASAVKWARQPERKEMILRAWKKSGLAVAWEQSAEKEAIFAEAVVLQEAGKLWDFKPAAKDSSVVVPVVCNNPAPLPGVSAATSNAVMEASLPADLVEAEALLEDAVFAGAEPSPEDKEADTIVEDDLLDAEPAEEQEGVIPGEEQKEEENPEDGPLPDVAVSQSVITAAKRKSGRTITKRRRLIEAS
jgi:hypothetical protein